MRLKYGTNLLFGSDSLREDKNLYFKGTVGISASPTIDHHWGFKPNVNTLIHSLEAYIDVLGLKVNVEGETKKVLEHILNRAIDKLEENMYSQYNLKKQIEPMWEKLADPIKLSTQYNIWYVIRPTQLHYNEIEIKNNIMKLGAGVHFDSSLYVGPEPTPKPLPLIPNLSKSKSADSRFDLKVPIIFTYNELTEVINKRLTNVDLALEGASITLDDFKLFGDANSLYLSSAFKATYTMTKASGVLYFKGQPKLKNGKLLLENLDFDVKTKNVLVKTAKILMKKKLIDKVQEIGTIDINEPLETIKKEFNSKIRQVQIKDSAILRGKMDAILIHNLQLSKNGIFVQANMKGNMQANIKNLELAPYQKL